MGKKLSEGLQNEKKNSLGVLIISNTFCKVFACFTDKKDYQIFLIYKEIQNGAVVKSYMNKGLLIYG
jgi:hypothetical protein